MKLRFPTMLRKMWSGQEVQEWLDNNAQLEAQTLQLNQVVKSLEEENLTLALEVERLRSACEKEFASVEVLSNENAVLTLQVAKSKGELTNSSAIRYDTQSHDYVLASDYEAEHALRLEAERQVGELREQRDVIHKQLSAWQGLACERLNMIEEGKAKLDTAMGLLREWDGMWNGGGIHNGPLTKLRKKTAAILNTTSTEGKDHE